MLATAALNSSSARPIQSTTVPEADTSRAAASVSGESKGSPETSDGVQSIKPSAGDAGAAQTQQDEDQLSLSKEARALADQETEGEAVEQGKEGPTVKVDEQASKGSKPDGAPKGDEELTESEKELIERLKVRDAEVRAHEQAHLAAAGGLSNGGPKFDYQRGPDGKQYAIGGSVNISVSPESSPEKTIAKADNIIRSALAPAEPSGKDRQIAAKARSMRTEAQQELRQEQLEETQKEEDGADKSDEDKSTTTGLDDSSKTESKENDSPTLGSETDESPLENNFVNNGVTYGFGGRSAGQSSLNRISLTA